MKNIRRIQQYLPQIYLIGSVIYYWVLTGTLLNLVAILLLAVLTILLILNNSIMGVITSILFFGLNLFMILAMVSELAEFASFNNKAQQLLLFGSIYLGLNLFVSIRMLIKWGQSVSPPTTKAIE